MDKAKTGRIVAFSTEQGFGRVRLDDGTEMPFDVGASTTVPVVGDVVRVEIGVGRLGRPKVIALASLDDTEESDDDHEVSFADALAALRAEGLARELSDKRAASLAADLFGDDADEEDFGAGDLLDVLAAYYDEGAKGAARAQHDKWLAHDWRFGQETDDVVAEIAALVGEPLLVQVSNAGSTLTLRERSGATHAIDFSAKSMTSLATIVSLWNELLARAGDRRRFYSLDTGGDWFAFYLLEPERAERLRRSLPFDERSPLPSESAEERRSVLELERQGGSRLDFRQSCKPPR